MLIDILFDLFIISICCIGALAYLKWKIKEFVGG